MELVGNPLRELDYPAMSGGHSNGPSSVTARLYPDFGGSPLWLPNRRVEWEEIKVSPSLQLRLEVWVNEALHNSAAVIMNADFDAEGHELARLLSDEMHWSVVYQD